MITHYDLFAGIGGFSYALDQVFNEEKINHIFCEWEAFPTAVLKKHWAGATYYGDIADLVADTNHTRLERGEETRDSSKGGEKTEQRPREQYLCILTGGFPCQPFSHAGRRKGTADDRYKWGEMFRVIQNVRPEWVIAENVRGLVTWNDGMVLETVCADLESEGYEVQTLIIPAVAVGAPHRRDRVWIVAHTNGIKRTRKKSRSVTEESEQKIHNRESHSTTGKFDGTNRQLPEDGKSNRHVRSIEKSWDKDWREVASATCNDRVDDGLSRWMDGVTISSAKHRKERLKACGNAIVPQVAMEIFEAIKEASKSAF